MIAYYDSVHGKECFRVLAILDEIFRTGLRMLPKYATTVVGRKITLLPTAQSISQLDAAYGRAKAHELLGQMEYTIFYRPAKADNETAEYIEKCLSYKSGFAHSKTEYEHGESQGESETRIPLMTANEIKLIDKTKVFVEMEGIRSIIMERLDWRRFPVLAQRQRIPPPRLSALPGLEQRVDSAWPNPQPLASWRLDPGMLRRQNQPAPSNGLRR